MKVRLYTLCFNEEDMIPWVSEYWNRIASSVDDFKVTVFDNLSTDSSTSLLVQHPYVEQIIPFKSDGLEDVLHKGIKDACYEHSKGRCDISICSDLDEVVYSKDLGRVFQTFLESGKPILGMKGYTLCGTVEPRYEKGMLLHQAIGKGYDQAMNHMPQWRHLFKFIVTNPNRLDHINWSVGQHLCSPTPSKDMVYESDAAFVFHINKGLSEEYFLKRRLSAAKRLSKQNLSLGMGLEYLKDEEATRREYRENLSRSVDISNL